MKSFAPITCPSCGHFDISPGYDVLGFPFHVVHQHQADPRGVGLHAAAGSKRTEKLLLPVMLWTCSSCQTPYLRVHCILCGEDHLAPPSKEAEGAFDLECAACINRRLQSN